MIGEPFTMIVLIVLIGCATGVLSTYFKSKHKYRSDPDLRERVERLEGLMGDGSLEDRVRALETIVTDDKRRLDREIQRL
ncbi:MAG: hypothetical protein OXG15_08095 [Gammaproteobacteria bacterium]|nr:hypothetical protein [Gammaproteobacteria bacterium]